MSDMQEVFIVGAARTPIGSFLGALSSLSAPQLGAVAIEAAVQRAGVPAERIGEVLMGNVLQAGVGQAPARQAMRGAGLPDAVPAVTVNKVCGSGLYAAMLAARAIRLGEYDVAVAGGMESMSNAPYLLPKARAGYRMGHGQLVDAMIHDGLWDPYNDFHMGNAGELCAREEGFDREAQDTFARQSYEFALTAQKEGRFREEIAPVTVRTRKGETVVEEDEEPGRARLEKMPSLRPAFQKDGTITAANASKIDDGAAALVLASGRAVERHGLTPLARVVAWGGHAQAPEWFTTAPVGASRVVLEKAGLGVEDIDLWEINEAFAVVTMAAMRQLGLPREKVNPWGGAVALGHPLGASGARILVTLLHALKARGGRRGIATLCLGGGEAVAMLVERA